MEKAHGASHPFLKPGRQSKNQRESTLQRQIIKDLHRAGAGHFYRIRNGATFDPKIGKFRSNTAEPGIPDICGYTKAGQAVFIECKFIEKVEEREKLVFPIKITEEQKDFLFRAHKAGCRAGVAFTVEDALAIALDSYVYPRHPRTYLFLPSKSVEEYAERYAAHKKALAEERKDPLTRDIFHATATLADKKEG